MRWCTKLTTDHYTCSDCAVNKLAFHFTYGLAGSRTDFTLRSMAVALYHQPLDKLAKNSAVKTPAKKKAAPKSQAAANSSYTARNL
jgi:hypothetical protein